MKAPLCRIELFGGLCVQQGDREITRFSTQKTAALLAFLACHAGKAHAREVLIDLLWPDADPASGRNSLSVALSSLRHQLEPPGVSAGAVLSADRFQVKLNADAICTDVKDFAHALESAAGAAGAERHRWLARAMELYRGALLPGFYEDWVLLEQPRWSDRFLAASRELSSLLEQAGDVEGAIECVRRAVAIDPLREDSQYDLMRLLAESEQPAAALRVYRDFERRLTESTDHAPSASLRLLARRLAEAAPLSLEPEKKASGPRRRHAIIPRRDLPAGTVTFLAVALDESNALDASAEAVQDVCQHAVRQHAGHPVGGDHLVAAFARASNALACALQAQRSTRNAASPLRMALDTREALPDRGRYATATTGHAAALLSAARAGQILCSEPCASLLRGTSESGVSLVDLGVFRLRGGEAPERLFSVAYPEAPPNGFPTPDAEPFHAGVLPLPHTRFFGREAQIARLLSALATDDRPPTADHRPPNVAAHGPSSVVGRLVTITGPGGIGKTRLAVEAAGRLLERYPGALWFVPLADAVDPALIVEALLKAMQLPRSHHADPLEQAAGALAGRPALLVLDDFERLVEGGATVVRRLLDLAPSLLCVVTSRMALRLEGESEFPLPPLPTPDAQHQTPEHLAECESIQLFLDRAQAVRPDFQITARNAADIAALCTRLDGLPLAIELAAARAQVLTPAQMLAQLDRHLDVLATRRRDVAERHRSLRAAMDCSFNLLAPELKRFFSRLSVFRGGWSLEAAEDICDAPLALDHLAQLRECSLVVSDEAGDEMRFHMMETIRAYAAEQLDGSDRADLFRRHAAHYLLLAERAEPKLIGPDQRRWLDRLEAEHGNIRAVLDRSGSSPSSEVGAGVGLRIAAAIWRFWEIRGHYTEARKRITTALAEPSAAEPSPARMKALRGLGNLARGQGDYDLARKLHTESLDLARQLGNRRETAVSLHNIGLVAWSQGDLDTASALAQEVVDMEQEVGDTYYLALSLTTLGNVAHDRGDLESARAYQERALRLMREVGDHRGISISLNNLGNVATDQGDYGRARVLHEESLALKREIGDKTGLAGTLHNIANTAAEQGDLGAARRLYEESLTLGRELGDKFVMVCNLAGIASLCGRQGQPDRALRLFGAVDSMRDALSAPLTPSDRADLREELDSLRSALAPASADAAWDAGTRLTWQQAVACALEEQGNDRP